MEEPEESSSETGQQIPEKDNGDERLEHFIGLLLDDDETTRWKAAEALGRQGDPKAVAPLIDTLWDDDPRVRQKAAWALGMIGDPDALGPLQRLYRMEREDAKDIIEEALESIKRARMESQ